MTKSLHDVRTVIIKIQSVFRPSHAWNSTEIHVNYLLTTFYSFDLGSRLNEYFFENMIRQFDLLLPITYSLRH